MNIALQISRLLYEHECVIVPGFGGFITNLSEAKIQPQKAGTILHGPLKFSFEPPKRQLAFNINLNQNDGLLINSLANQYEIGYQQAKVAVENFVNQVRNDLKLKRCVTFDQLGTFTLNSENNLLFEPDRRYNFALESFGMDGFEYNQLPQENIVKRAATKIDGNPKVHKLVRSKVFRNVMVGIPLALGLFYVAYRANNSMNENLNFSTFNPVTIQTKTHDTSQVAPNRKIYSASFVSDSTIKISPKSSEKFYLVAASFDNTLKAEQLKNQLNSEGYPAEVIKSDEKHLRVSYKSFTNKTEALSGLEKLRKTTGNNGIWLLKVTDNE